MNHPPRPNTGGETPPRKPYTQTELINLVRAFRLVAKVNETAASVLLEVAQAEECLANLAHSRPESRKTEVREVVAMLREQSEKMNKHAKRTLVTAQRLEEAA